MTKSIIQVLLACFFFIYGTSLSFSQNWLKDAENSYDEGQIEKVPQIVENEKFNKRASRESNIQARRLAILSYIYDDKPHLADSAMLSLLIYEKEYKLFREDSATEYSYLYQTYRTQPIFGYGIVAGLNSTTIHIKEPFGIGNIKENTGKYSNLRYGFQVGADFDIYLDPLLKNLSLKVDILYKQINFQYKYPFQSPLNDKPIVLTSEETQSWLNIPFTLVYSFNQKEGIFYSNRTLDQIHPYIKVGAFTSLLISATSKNIRTYNDKSHPDVKGEDVDMFSVRSKINFGPVIGGGIKYKVRMGYAFFDATYNFGILNQVNEKTRFTNENLIFDYFYQDNDFTSSNISFSLGYTRLFYLPKKLKPKFNKKYNEPLIKD